MCDEKESVHHILNILFGMALCLWLHANSYTLLGLLLGRIVSVVKNVCYERQVDAAPFLCIFLVAVDDGFADV